MDPLIDNESPENDEGRGFNVIKSSREDQEATKVQKGTPFPWVRISFIITG
jgi:hypothetical protein